MRLDLHEIIEDAGCVAFDCLLDLSELELEPIAAYLSPVRAVGKVVNSAGVLTLTGSLEVRLRMICDRCGEEFETDRVFPVSAALAAELQDSDNPDIFLLEDDCADLKLIAEDALVLGMESKILCREDCKGLCPACGKSLNEGPCQCRAEPDPRLAVLGQLLSE